MDRDAGMEEAPSVQIPAASNSHEEIPEQPNAPTADISTATVAAPEVDSVIDLPQLHLAAGSINEGAISSRNEIPDSDAASEFSSPAKVNNQGEMHDMAATALRLSRNQSVEMGLREGQSNGEMKTTGKEEAELSGESSLGKDTIMEGTDGVDERGSERLEGHREGKEKDQEGDGLGNATMVDVSAGEMVEAVDADTSGAGKVEMKENGEPQVEHAPSKDDAMQMDEQLPKSDIQEGETCNQEVSPSIVNDDSGGGPQTSTKETQKQVTAEKQQNSVLEETLSADVAIQIDEEPPKGDVGNDESGKEDVPSTNGNGGGGDSLQTFSKEAEKEVGVEESKRSQVIPDSDADDEEGLWVTPISSQPAPNAPPVEVPLPPAPLSEIVPNTSELPSIVTRAVSTSQTQAENETRELECLGSDGISDYPSERATTQDDSVSEKKDEPPSGTSFQEIFQGTVATHIPSPTPTQISELINIPNLAQEIEAAVAEDDATAPISASLPAPQASSLPTTEESTKTTQITQKKRKESPSAALPAPEQLPQASIEASPKEKVKFLGSTSFPAPEGSLVMEELKAMKMKSLLSRISGLEEQIAAQESKLDEASRDLKRPAGETVKNHIKLLHDYNDIRDVGQGLIGMIADSRGVRISELYEEFGVDLKD